MAIFPALQKLTHMNFTPTYSTVIAKSLEWTMILQIANCKIAKLQIETLLYKLSTLS